MLRPHCFLMVSSAPTGVKLIKAPISYKPTRVERQEHHSLQHGNPRFEQHSPSPDLTSGSPIMSSIQAAETALQENAITGISLRHCRFSVPSQTLDATPPPRISRHHCFDITAGLNHTTTGARNLQSSRRHSATTDLQRHCWHQQQVHYHHDDRRHSATANHIRRYRHSHYGHTALSMSATT
jgi:hypothetical protein